MCANQLTFGCTQAILVVEWKFAAKTESGVLPAEARSSPLLDKQTDGYDDC